MPIDMFQSTNNLEWYDPAAVTTANGSLVITYSEMFNHNLNFQGGERSYLLTVLETDRSVTRPHLNLVRCHVIHNRLLEHVPGTSSVSQVESSRLLFNSPTQTTLLACGLRYGRWVTWEELATAQLWKAW